MTLTTAPGRLVLLALLIASGAAPVRAQHAPDAEHAAEAAVGAGHGEEQGEARLDAVHHTSDGVYLDFEPMGVLELPRIFVVRRADGSLGLDAFASSSAALASGRYRAVPAEGHGGSATVATTPDAPEGSAAERSDVDAHSPLAGDPTALGIETASGLSVEMLGGEPPYEAGLVPVGGEVLVDLSITRHLVFIFLSMLLVAVLFIGQARKYARGVGRTSAPRGLLQNMLESLVVYIRDEVARPNLGKKTDRYLPYLLTVFFFVLVANLLGLVPWGTTATSNITVTAVLAIFTFIVTQFAGTKDYWMHVFNPPGVPGFVKPLLVPIEILGLFTKPFALAVRLFANMVAGHLVILNLIGLIFVIGGTFNAAAGYATAVPAVLLTVFVYALELLVAFIQAYVFTVLSALFIGMASAEHEHDHDHSADHGPTAHDVAVSRSNGQAVHVIAERTVGTEGVLAFSAP